MAKQAVGSASETMAQERRRGASLAAAAMAVAAALGLGACASPRTGALEGQQPAAPGPSAPVVAEPAGAIVAVPRQIAVLPRSRPARRPSQPPAETPWASSSAVPATGYLWPVRGRIARGFGAEPDGRRCDGLDIAAAEGSPVLAAEAGIVAYAGDELPGYGNMLLIEHGNGFTTIYAHNRALLVRVGDTVRRGEAVATVGRPGGVAEPQLHFQLRAGDTPIDPAPHLVPGTTLLASVDSGTLRGRAGE